MCAGGDEANDVRSFTIGFSGRVRLQAPLRAFAGFPVAFGIKASVGGV